MSDVRKKKATNVSRSRSVEELANYWDTHSLADHWETTREAAVDVRAPRRRRVVIEPELYGQIDQLAHSRGVTAETLVNLWLAEQLRQNRNSPQTLASAASK